MELSKTERAAPGERPGWDILRDPALWAWVVVALLAIFPARAALANDCAGREPGPERGGHVVSGHAVAPGSISSPARASGRMTILAARRDR